MRLRVVRGFTLIEVAVAAALVAMLAAVTAPYLVSFLDHQRAQTTADKLSDLAKGIAAFTAVVKEGTPGTTLNTYPGLLWQLDSTITATSTSPHTSCGSAANTTDEFNATAVTAWTSNGPFVTFYIPTSGLVTPLGLVEDSLARSNTTPAAGTLAIRMTAIDSADAVMLDGVVDGGDGGTTGTLRYVIGSTTAHMADVQYLVPVGAKC
jgi:prepilin-type N-terminal cleavage/methylation domain-containing protein